MGLRLHCCRGYAAARPAVPHIARAAARLVALAAAALAVLAPGAAAPIPLDGFEDAAAWQPRTDGGQPPEFRLDVERVHVGRGSLRVVYRNGAKGWGNLQRPLALPAAEGALSFWLCKEHSDPAAAMHVWLEEPDGDLWVIAVTEGEASLGKWAPGWRRVVLPLPAFRFDGRGNKRPERGEVVRMLLGCNYGDLEAVVDDLTFEPAAAAPVATAGPLVLRRHIALGDGGPETAGLLSGGWYDAEGPDAGRWTGRDGQPSEIRLALSAGRDALVAIRGQIPADRWADGKQVSVAVDGRPAQGMSVDLASGTIRFRIAGAPAAREVRLSLDSGRFVPADSGQGGDTRSLGMKLTSLDVAEFPYGDTPPPPKRSVKGHVAVLKDDLPRSGAPSDPDRLARLLRDAGYAVVFLKAADLVNPLYLSKEHFDLLVLPYGGVYPAEGKEALVAYLRAGGAFLSTGGYAFNDPVVLYRGKWVGRESYLSAFGTGYVDVGAPGDDPFLFGDWHSPEGGEVEWGGAAGAVTKRWTGARAGVLLSMDPEKAYTVKVALAFRGVEWAAAQLKEAAPIRGRVVLNGEGLGEFAGEAGTAVLEFAVPKGLAHVGRHSELVFETETWSPARPPQAPPTSGVLGGPGTTDGRELGIAVNWVKAIPEGVNEADLVPPTAAFDVQINTARGKAQDALGLDPEQIGAFDPSYPLRDAVYAVGAPRQHLAPASLRLDGPFQGFAAAGMFGSNSAVVPHGYARWIPLMDAKDADGRQRGALGALALHYDGPYAGSAWAFFGVTNRDLFAPGNPTMERLFVGTADALMRRTFLHGLRTQWACYRAGEAVKASVTVRNAGSQPQKLRVRFTMEGGPVLKEVDAGEVAPGKSKVVHAAWPAFPFETDLYRVTATLLAGTQAVDTMETGFTVWTPGMVLSGPRVDLKENYFRVDGRPAFLCGTNQTGMIFASSFEDPLVWDRDLAQMRDHGVNLMRVLHFSPFAKGPLPQGPWVPKDLQHRPEALVRQTDALVQLCQKHGVVLFLSLHDWMGVGLSDAELEIQRDWARFWAARYRDVPGILYDVQNEPTVDVPDSPDLRREWNAFLRRRHGSDAALRAAWATAPPEKPLGEIPLAAPAAEWGSVCARDYAEFRVEVLNRWVRANVEGVRAGDPDALCTVGYLQTLTHAEKLLGVRYTDFSNMHSYLAPADLPKNLKLIDRRFEGKSFSLGEFGAKCHPAWKPTSFVGVTEAQGADYFLRVGHYALGLGASFIANWSWKDMIDCVFPWGTVHPGDGVPKDVLPAYRNLSLFFRLFRPAYRDPGLYLLVPDGHRLGGGAAVSDRATLTAVQWLIDLGVPFNAINEHDLERLPRTASALIWPMPYCPDDDAFARVKAFAQGGGVVLVTGDLSYDADRRRTRAARLEELCGVRLAEGAADGPPDLRAAVPVVAAGARSAEVKGIPLLTYGLGQGRVCYCPAPVEAGGPEGMAVYRRFLETAGGLGLETGPNRGGAGGGLSLETGPGGSVEAPAGVHAFRVETAESGGAWCFFNTAEGGGPAMVAAGRVRLALAPGRPGFVRVDAQGHPVAVEAQGRVVAAGRPLLEITGHAMVAALDGKPLAESRAVLVLPVGAGEVRFPRASGWRDAVAQAGEFRRARWTELAQAPAIQGNAVVVRIAPERRNDLFLLCERADLPRWREVLERLLRFE